MLQSNKYLLVHFFGKEGIRPYIVKAIDSYLVETFFTLDGKILDFKDKENEIWATAVVLEHFQTYKLAEISHYGKLLIDDTPWHELEQSLEEHGIY